jgi:DnaJ-class molecular chaperone
MQLKYGEGNPFMRMNSMDEFNDINNIFNMMFGQGFPGQGFPGQGFGPGMPEIRVFHGGGPGINIRTQMFHSMQKPDPLNKNIKITLEQCFNGCSVPIEIERYVINNNVKITEREELFVNLPSGVNENEIVVLHGKGNAINGNYSEIRIQIEITNNTEFVRQWLDLVVSKKISLKESLCGFSFELKYINGKVFTINNQNGNIILPEYQKQIQGMGLTRENHVGNLIIHFKVTYPEKLTDLQIEKLREIL